MFAGHLGAGLAIARAERSVNVGVFVAAALLLDVLLWLFVLLGWESVGIPPDFTTTHQAEFEFPWSHGLAASLAWAIVAAAVATWRRSVRLAALLAAAVFSHWLLDVLVHRPELPLLGAHSARLGLSAWDHLPIALALESAIVLLGVGLFLQGRALPRARLLALAGFVLALLAFTIAGMTVAPAPPSPRAMAASSLATLLVVCGVVGWLGRTRRFRG